MIKCCYMVLRAWHCPSQSCSRQFSSPKTSLWYQFAVGLLLTPDLSEGGKNHKPSLLNNSEEGLLVANRFLRIMCKRNLFLPSRKMLPSTSVNSSMHGNGVLSSRDAARHTAGAKRYKYLRRLFRFRQMDFEFAAWQMLYLFTSPQRVYRNFHYRKQTKDQWARDDPAFLVLLSIWLCGKSCFVSLP